MKNPHRQLRTPFYCFAIAVLATLPFLPSLGYGFLAEWDDGGFVSLNPFISWTVENLIYNLTTNLQGVYTPLTTLSLMVDNVIFNGNPAGFHFVNILLYGGCAVFLFLIMRRLSIPVVCAFILTLLWAWNPCKAETVAWISERKGVASAFFAFGAFYYFMRSCELKKMPIGAAILIFIACFFKPWVLPVPGLMILYAWTLSPDNYRKVLQAVWLPALTGTLAAAIVVGMTFGESSASRSFSLIDTFGVLRYIAASLWPLNLNPIHPRAGFIAVCPELLIGIAMIIALWAMAARSGKWRVSLVFSIACIALTLPLIVSGSFTNANYTDRYGFLVSALIWCWIGVVGLRYFNAFPRVAILGTIVLASGYLLTLTLYLDTFSDSRLVFAHAAINENCPPKALEGLALVALNRNDSELLYQSGRLFIERAHQIQGNEIIYADTGNLFCAMAVALEAQKCEFLERILNDLDGKTFYSPEIFLPRAYNLVIEGLLSAGKRKEALRLLEQQQRRGDGNAFELAFAAGLSGYLTNDFERAVHEWRVALNIRPTDKKVQINLKAAEAKLKQNDDESI